jgi:plastocyanin
MRAGRLTAGLAALASFAVAAPGASAATGSVHVEFQAFDPSSLDVLPGETVEWSNVSTRRHTVTADDGSFDSGDLFGGDHFSWTFNTTGSFSYHCRIHAGMTGEVDVRRVTLGPLPPGLVPSGTPVQVKGRTATPAVPVRIERSTGGAFKTVATALPRPDGSWSANVKAERTADYRAAVGSDVSETRSLRVSDRKVLVSATRHGVSVRVVPPAPYAPVALELRLRERFGWWITSRRKLDYMSEANFHVTHRAAARAVLLAGDGWTARAVSRVVTPR